MNSTTCERKQVLEDEEPQFKPVKRAAAILDVSTHCLYRKIREGAIPAYRFGRKILLDMKEVKEAMRIRQ